MENIQSGPTEEMWNVLDDIVYVDEEPTRRLKPKRSSILKPPRIIDDDEADDLFEKRKSGNSKRRVSFAEKFQVKEIHTGNVYDIPGKSTSSSDSLQSEGLNFALNSHVAAQENTSIHQISEETIQVLSVTKVQQIGNEEHSLGSLHQKHKIISDEDLEPCRKKLNSGSVDTSIDQAANNVLQFRENLTSDFTLMVNTAENEFIKKAPYLTSDNIHISSTQNDLQQKYDSEKVSCTEDSRKENFSKNASDDFVPMPDPNSKEFLSYNVPKDLPNERLPPIISITDISFERNKENIFIDRQNKNILVTNPLLLKLSEKKSLQNCPKSTISAQNNLMFDSQKEDMNAKSSHFLTIATSLEPKLKSVLDKTCVVNSSMDLTCLPSELDLTNELHLSAEDESTAEEIKFTSQATQLKKPNRIDYDLTDNQLNKTRIETCYMDLTHIAETTTKNSLDSEKNALDLNVSPPLYYLEPRAKNDQKMTKGYFKDNQLTDNQLNKTRIETCYMDLTHIAETKTKNSLDSEKNTLDFNVSPPFYYLEPRAKNNQKISKRDFKDDPLNITRIETSCMDLTYIPGILSDSVLDSDKNDSGGRKDDLASLTPPVLKYFEANGKVDNVEDFTTNFLSSTRIDHKTIKESVITQSVEISDRHLEKGNDKYTDVAQTCSETKYFSSVGMEMTCEAKNKTNLLAHGTTCLETNGKADNVEDFTANLLSSTRIDHKIIKESVTTQSVEISDRHLEKGNGKNTDIAQTCSETKHFSSVGMEMTCEIKNKTNLLAHGTTCLETNGKADNVEDFAANLLSSTRIDHKIIKESVTTQSVKISDRHLEKGNDKNTDIAQTCSETKCFSSVGMEMTCEVKNKTNLLVHDTSDVLLSPKSLNDKQILLTKSNNCCDEAINYTRGLSEYFFEDVKGKNTVSKPIIESEIPKLSQNHGKTQYVADEMELTCFEKNASILPCQSLKVAENATLSSSSQDFKNQSVTKQFEMCSEEDHLQKKSLKCPELEKSFFSNNVDNIDVLEITCSDLDSRDNLLSSTRIDHDIMKKCKGTQTVQNNYGYSEKDKDRNIETIQSCCETKNFVSVEREMTCESKNKTNLFAHNTSDAPLNSTSLNEKEILLRKDNNCCDESVNYTRGLPEYLFESAKEKNTVIKPLIESEKPKLSQNHGKTQYVADEMELTCYKKNDSSFQCQNFEAVVNAISNSCSKDNKKQSVQLEMCSEEGNPQKKFPPLECRQVEKLFVSSGKLQHTGKDRSVSDSVFISDPDTTLISKTKHFTSDYMELTLKPCVVGDEKSQNVNLNKHIPKTKYFSASGMDLTCMPSSISFGHSQNLCREVNKTVAEDKSIPSKCHHPKELKTTEESKNKLKDSCQKKLPSLSISILNSGNNQNFVTTNENLASKSYSDVDKISENINPVKTFSRTEYFSSFGMDLTCMPSSISSINIKRQCLTDENDKDHSAKYPKLELVQESKNMNLNASNEKRFPVSSDPVLPTGLDSNFVANNEIQNTIAPVDLTSKSFSVEAEQNKNLSCVQNMSMGKYFSSNEIEMSCDIRNDPDCFIPLVTNSFTDSSFNPERKYSDLSRISSNESKEVLNCKDNNEIQTLKDISGGLPEYLFENLKGKNTNTKPVIEKENPKLLQNHIKTKYAAGEMNQLNKTRIEAPCKDLTYVPEILNDCDRRKQDLANLSPSSAKYLETMDKKGNTGFLKIACAAQVITDNLPSSGKIDQYIIKESGAFQSVEKNGRHLEKDKGKNKEFVQSCSKAKGFSSVGMEMTCEVKNKTISLAHDISNVPLCTKSLLEKQISLAKVNHFNDESVNCSTDLPECLFENLKEKNCNSNPMIENENLKFPQNDVKMQCAAVEKEPADYKQSASSFQCEDFEAEMSTISSTIKNSSKLQKKYSENDCQEILSHAQNPFATSLTKDIKVGNIELTNHDKNDPNTPHGSSTTNEVNQEIVVSLSQDNPEILQENIIKDINIAKTSKLNKESEFSDSEEDEVFLKKASQPFKSNCDGTLSTSSLGYQTPNIAEHKEGKTVIDENSVCEKVLKEKRTDDNCTEEINSHILGNRLNNAGENTNDQTINADNCGSSSDSTQTENEKDRYTIERIHSLKKKFINASENEECLWNLKDMDDEEAVFEILGDSLFASYYMHVPISFDSTSPTKMVFKHIRQNPNKVDELGFMYFLSLVSQYTEIVPFCADKLLDNLSKIVECALLTKCFIKDLWFIKCKNETSIDNSLSMPRLNVKILNMNHFSCFSLTIPIDFKSYPQEKIIPVIQYLEYKHVKNEVIINVIKEIQPGKNYLSRMVKAASTF